MTMTMTVTRRVATYARVSSDDQAERGTIQTQIGELERRLAGTAGVEVVARYVDDGVSGTIRLAERPGGRRLMADAAKGRFDELHVYAPDRLGRDFIDLATVRRELEAWGIRLITIVAGEPDLLSFDIQAAVADHARRAFLKVSAAGMTRAAREGRYTGGIVPFGYLVEGVKPRARLVPDETPLWAGLSAADVVRRMYQHLAVDDWSCKRVADELNALGVPTHYGRDGRGVRGKRTRGTWRSGRIRNMVVETTYRGELRYGQRAKKPREVISATVEPLVPPELWQAAQETLARHRVIPRNTRRIYLLRGVLRCSLCGLTYVGSTGRDGIGWYRCGGQLHERRASAGPCAGRSIREDHLEPMVWQDIERFLRHPGDVLDELDGRAEREAQTARVAEETVTLRRALAGLQDQWQRTIDLAVRGVLGDDDLRPQRQRIDVERAGVEARLAALSSPSEEPEPVDVALLDQLRANLEAGLTIEQRQEIVRLLVAGITIKTVVNEDGTKDAAATISYRFPAVVETRTGTDSWPRSTGTAPESATGRSRAQCRRHPPRVVAAARQGRCGRIRPAHPGRGRLDGQESLPRVGARDRRPPWPRMTPCGVASGTADRDAAQRRRAGPRCSR